MFSFWKIREVNVNLIQETVGESLFDFGLRNEFLVKIQKSQQGKM